jgi:hypothetical protein
MIVSVRTRGSKLGMPRAPITMSALPQKAGIAVQLAMSALGQ